VVALPPKIAIAAFRTLPYFDLLHREGKMSEKEMPVRAKPELVRARFPSKVANGALVYAPVRGEFFPAIKWARKEDDGVEYVGFAFLVPTDSRYQHPIAIDGDAGEWVLRVVSPWHIRAPIGRVAMRVEDPSEPTDCGLMFDEEGWSYLRIPLDQGSRLDRHVIRLDTGASPRNGLRDRGHALIAGWELIVGDHEQPVASWPPRPS
jgi:hypothetical protein